MVICLERGADLHVAQLTPQIGFTFLVPAYPGSPRQRAVKWACVCESDLTCCIPLDTEIRHFGTVLSSKSRNMVVTELNLTQQK